jgi:ribosomal protein S18 acetylase RimI-like enzyme
MNGAGCDIRYARLEDREFIRDLGSRTAGSNLSSLRPAPVQSVVVSYERLLAYVYSASSIILIAWLEQRPVGFVIIVDSLPDEVTGLAQAFIAYAAVEENVRNRGIGRALFESAEQVARERGLPHMALMVTDENEAALSLYAKLGYQTERRLLCKTL